MKLNLAPLDKKSDLAGLVDEEEEEKDEEGEEGDHAEQTRAAVHALDAQIKLLTMERDRLMQSLGESGTVSSEETE